MKFIGVIGTVQNYLAKWGKRLNFSKGVVEIARKSTMCQGREKIEFRQWDYLNSCPAQALPMKCPKCMLGGVSERENNCGNQVAEIEGMRREKIWIVATRLPKMKEKKMLRPQYFYIIFTTNYRWLVVISSNLNLTLRLPFWPNNNN